MVRKFVRGIVLLGALALLGVFAFVVTGLLGIPDRIQVPVVGYVLAAAVLGWYFRRKWNRSRNLTERRSAD
ncbi:hypothetical protein ACIRRX_09825 [Streptomyces bacillaris]